MFAPARRICLFRRGCWLSEKPTKAQVCSMKDSFGKLRPQVSGKHKKNNLSGMVLPCASEFSTRMLDFGQFDFGQLAEVEIGRSRTHGVYSFSSFSDYSSCFLLFLFLFFFFFFLLLLLLVLFFFFFFCLFSFLFFFVPKPLCPKP